MKIKFNTENEKDLATLSSLLEILDCSNANGSASKKPKTKKDEKQVSAKPVEVEVNHPGTTTGQSQESSESEITEDMVREVLTMVVIEHRDTCAAKLRELGAEKFTALDPSKHKEFYDFLLDLRNAS